MTDTLELVQAWRTAYDEALGPLYESLIAKYGDEWVYHLEEARRPAGQTATEAVAEML